jgi:predicted permease
MGLWERARYLFNRDKFDQEMDDEVLAHIETRTAELQRSGLAPEEALRQARLEFGNVSRSKEATRRVWGVTTIEGIAQDLRYGFRQLRRSPGFAATAILSLALGIGANTAIFQLLNAVRLRSLPVRDPQQLVEVRVLGNTNMGVHNEWGSLTYPLWEQIRDHQESFSGVFAWSFDNFSLGQAVDHRTARVFWVSGNAFPTLDIHPIRGRLLTPTDDTPGCANTAVVSYGFWQRQFGGLESALGSRIELNELPFTVVGVTAPDFSGINVGRAFDVALPMCAVGHFSTRSTGSLTQKNLFWLGVIGRLKDDLTPSEAARVLKASSAAWFDAVAPGGYDDSSMQEWRKLRMTAEPRPGGVSDLRNVYEPSLWLLLGITTLVLGIACVNLANLMLARSSARAREYAVRMALGASRWRVISQLFWESLWIACGGAALGTALALFLSQAAIRLINSERNAVELSLGLDWRAVAFIAAAATLASIIFGLSTAIHATRANATGSVNAGTRNTTLDRSRFSFQRTLMVGQIAISLVLVMVSLLFTKSFRNLLTTDVGFRLDGLNYLSLDFSRLQLADADLKPYANNLLGRIRAIPGVEAAALTTHFPLSNSGWSLGVRFPGREQAGDAPTYSQFTWISPGYFSTMGIPVQSGRDLTDGDTASSPRVLLVNEQFVRQYLNGVNPIGQTVRSLREPGYPETLYQVVGVVQDTKYGDLRESLLPIVYAPDLQHPAAAPRSLIAVRTRLPLVNLEVAAREGLRQASPAIRLNSLRNLRAEVLNRLSPERSLALLSGFFGVLAVVLATIGLYGVVSYMVSARRNEIGIRIALGASRRDVVTMIMRQTATLLAIGLVVGLGATIALSKSIESLLFGLQPNDPLSFGGAALVLIVIGVCASWMPARRSAKLDPNAALRED